MRLGLAFSAVFSYGVLYALERGNVILVAWGLTLIFFMTMDSERRLLRELGFISLALAFGLKLYPAVFGLLLLKRGRLGQALRTAVYGILSIALPMLCFSEGLAGLKTWLGIVLSFGGNGGELLNYSARKQLTDLISEILQFYGVSVNTMVLTVVSLMLCLFFIVSAFLGRDRWKQVADLTMVVFLISPQGAYGMAFFLLPLLIFIRDVDRFRWSNVICVLCLILLTINLPIFSEIEWPRSLVYQMIYVVMIIQGIFGLIVLKKIRRKEWVKFRDDLSDQRRKVSVLDLFNVSQGKE